MALSKKHFEMVARNIKRHVEAAAANPKLTSDQRCAVYEALQEAATSFCTDFYSENPRFDGARFIRACGF